MSDQPAKYIIKGNGTTEQWMTKQTLNQSLKFNKDFYIQKGRRRSHDKKNEWDRRIFGMFARCMRHAITI